MTPPFGVNLFAALQVANLSLERVVFRLLLFVLTVLACLMAVTSVPTVSLFFRDLLYSAGSWIGRRGDFQGDFSWSNER